ncbi:hypothetical protein TNIN_350001 [Trichonephila inaurata madagascariensis]|uniref:Uncharacterized protein n=1 Tax=Trichonephila inaurata madagascariensis TaxID=2747483 RepID=A0A8X6MFU6_9ARAC|nr:hypothetical protein TNIN_350001 [Trichonephila inaurata madagascariensis]
MAPPNTPEQAFYLTYRPPSEVYRPESEDLPDLPLPPESEELPDLPPPPESEELPDLSSRPETEEQPVQRPATQPANRQV